MGSWRMTFENRGGLAQGRDREHIGKGFVQDTFYFLGIPMSILLLLEPSWPCHLLIGVRRYPHVKLPNRETPTAKTEARVACARCR
jgi:hypothetical protein